MSDSNKYAYNNKNNVGFNNKEAFLISKSLIEILVKDVQKLIQQFCKN